MILRTPKMTINSKYEEQKLLENENLPPKVSHNGKSSQSQQKKSAAPKTYSLGWKFLRRFGACLKMIFPSVRSKSTLLFMLLLTASLVQQYLIYHVGLIPSRFFQVLGAKDKQAFKGTILTAVYFIVGIALANSAVKYISGLLYVQWRDHLTSNLHEKYFFQETFFHVSQSDNKIDNADQRITQDVDKFCLQLSDISSKLLISPFTITYYSYKCFKNTSFYGPVSIYTYFVIGSVINRTIMSPIVGLVVEQEKNEGDFRFDHVNIRTSSESVAFLKGSATEHARAKSIFEKLLYIQLRIVNLEFWLNFSVNLFDYLGSILSYFVIAIPIFAGVYNNLSPVQLAALISQNAFVSMYLINCFSTLMDLSGKVTDLAGYTHRIGELLEALFKYNEHCRKIARYSYKENDDALNMNEKEQLILCDLCNVSYSAGESKTQLVENLNLTLMSGKSVLIMGPTGTGKSSLLRVLRSLWKPTSGEVECFLPIHPQGIFFLPQKVFLTHGSLYDQVRYPLIGNHEDDLQEATNVLRALKCVIDVGLLPLLERTGNMVTKPDRQWHDILSPGEMQRLSFARVFYHKPKLAVLDEPTSALCEEEEECYYTYCHQLEITLLSVGHHDSLKKYHNALLLLKGKGAWEFTELKNDQQT